MGPAFVQLQSNAKAVAQSKAWDQNIKPAFALTDTLVFGERNWWRTNIGVGTGSISLCNAKKNIAEWVCTDLKLFWFRDVNCCCSHISSVDLCWRDWEQNIAMGGWWGIYNHICKKNLPCSDLLLALPMPFLMESLCLETSTHRGRNINQNFVLSLQMHFRSKALLGENSHPEMWWEWSREELSHAFHLLSFLIYMILILLKAM